MAIWQFLLAGVGLAITLSGIFAVFWANNRNTMQKTQQVNYEKAISSYKDVITAQEEKMKTLGEEIRELRKLYTDNMKLIGQLEGELKSWKELPIRELAEHIGYITEVQYIMARHMGIDNLPELARKTAPLKK